MMEDFKKLDKAIEELKNRTSEKPVGSEIVEATINKMYTGVKWHHRLWETFFSLNPIGTAIAASITIICILGALFISMHFSFVSTAWAEVQSNVKTVDYLKFYELEFDGNTCISSKQGWYYRGVIYTVLDANRLAKDDGKAKVVYNSDASQLSTGASEFPYSKEERYSNYFDQITRGILQYSEENLSETVPVEYGDDFMIYDFGSPMMLKHSIESVCITVGRQSKLPIMIKAMENSSTGEYTMIIFEYTSQSIPEAIIKITEK